MISVKKTDLIFISKLELKMKLIAEKKYDEKSSLYWILKIKTENKETNFFEDGVFTAYRGEPRQFKNINAIISLLEEVFENKKVSLKVRL